MSALAERAQVNAQQRTRLPSPTKKPAPSERALRSTPPASNDNNSNAATFKTPAAPLTRSRSQVTRKTPITSQTQQTPKSTSRPSSRPSSRSGINDVGTSTSTLTRRSSVGSRPTSRTPSATISNSKQQEGHKRVSSFAPPSSFKAPKSEAEPNPPITAPVRRSNSQTRRQPVSRAPAGDPQTPRRTPSTSNRTAQKPVFSTHQQTYTPIRRPTSSHGPSSTAAASSPLKLTHTGPSTAQVRRQTELLHLSLLHAAAAPTLNAYTRSAYTKLSHRHAQLLATYRELRILERQSRQFVNLLALHRWSGGNKAGLIRKIGVLSSVLSELTDLIAGPVGRDAADSNKALDIEVGEYAHLVTQFEGWIAYVRSTWDARDAAAARARVGMDEVEVQNDPVSAKIEGLGDGVKNTMRTLTEIVNRLSIRLDQLRQPKIEDIVVQRDDRDDFAELERTETFKSTPALLVEYAYNLLEGMKEELQVMREVEFEVVVGEQSWEQSRLKMIESDIAGSFRTPVKSIFG